MIAVKYVVYWATYASHLLILVTDWLVIAEISGHRITIDDNTQPASSPAPVYVCVCVCVCES